MRPGYVRSVEFVDVYVNRRAIGQASMQDDRLLGSITMRGRPSVRPAESGRCPHERVVHAFAHRRSSDQHWPIAYCVDCFGVVAGVDPLVRASRPRWKHDERNLVIGRWAREWPKRGRPRRDLPPAETVWPDAA
jgi:hypothetical protein